MKEKSSSIVAPKRSEHMYMMPAQDSSGTAGLEVAAPSTIEVGTGYDFLLGWRNDLNAGLIMTDKTSIKESALTKTSFEFQVNNYETVANESSYEDSLSASAKVSASYWGVNVSASVSALMERKASETSVSTFVQTLIGTKTCVLEDYGETRLSEAAMDLLLNDNGVMQQKANAERLKNFIRHFGTHYVQGYSYGGSFNGSVTVQTSSNTDHKAVAAQLRVGGTGAELEAAFSAAVTKVAKNHNVTVTATSTGASGLGSTGNVHELIAANLEFQKRVTATGGNRVVAHLLPWGSAEPFRKLVPIELIDEYLSFGSMNPILLEETRADFVRLSYIANCVHTYKEDYRPGGPWTFYYAGSTSDVVTCLEALNDPLLQAESDLDKISLRDLSRKTYDLPPAIVTLRNAMNAVKTKCDSLQLAIDKREYSRLLQFSLYDKSGNEAIDTMYSFGYSCFKSLFSLGRNVGGQHFEIENDDEGKVFYSGAAYWTPMNDPNVGCYFGSESDAKFLSNTNKGEIELATGIVYKDKYLKNGPYSLRAKWAQK